MSIGLKRLPPVWKALCLPLMLALLVHSASIRATSVVEVSVDEMLQDSGLVFEGEVVAIKVREFGNHGIQTQVTFKVVDVIKGKLKGRKVTLGFMGGVYGDREITVSEMQIPVMHERGIYFVESPERNLVHPLYGWSQGHLKLLRDSNDVDRVTTAIGDPVTGMESTTMKRSGKLSKGAARGLKLGHSRELSTALDKHEFKRQLRARQQ